MRPAVDLERLAEFSDGTTEGLRTLVTVFLSDVGETIEELTAAVAAAVPSDIERLAHRAGGASAACGASRLAELLLTLEDAARGARPAAAASLVQHVTAELERVTAFLRTYVDGVGDRP
jgi:HPt (histidine-containing phosphotransfer) domain-containing protein